MCEIVYLIVTPGSLRVNIVCPQVAHPHGSEKLTKCTSDDNCRGTADLDMFVNHSYPHRLLLFLQSSRLIKASIQLCPHMRPHTHTHTHRDCCVSDTSSFAPSFLQFSLPLGRSYCGLFNAAWSNQFLVFCFIAVSPYSNRKRLTDTY
ncbi:unnamed protein product [Hymenolepis diminuta]|uniref:Uncharacterized protein n=1 Tax=Hymenolepis diminuta TaxID=6216 RepID=A0A564ZAK1_HYMDI|nr:unnamed protein product [Hymenolepis diminuta]